MSLWQTLAVALGLRRAAQRAGGPGSGQAMKLVVGLGNHGREYAGTRHNIGYDTIDRLAEKYGPVRFRRQFEGRFASASVGGEKVLLLEPETYMNRSGYAVQPALAFYQLDAADLLVICDDLNLAVGTIRVRRGGSDGGQKGLRSIAEQLGTTDYPRLRIGIGPVPARIDATDFVLARFTAKEREVIDAALDRAVEAVAVWSSDGIEACMNRFN